jgi:hypothetical protein
VTMRMLDDHDVDRSGWSQSHSSTGRANQCLFPRPARCRAAHSRSGIRGRRESPRHEEERSRDGAKEREEEGIEACEVFMAGRECK